MTSVQNLADAPGSLRDDFFQRGWCRFAYDPVLADWIEQTLPIARALVSDPEHAEWLRCGGTWFAGVNILTNDADGAVAGGPPLAGQAVEFVESVLRLTGFAWDKAQVSVCYPDYPKPMASETEAAYGYRRNRDAAHVDGLLPVGPERRRHLNEHHGFLLGIPMAEADAGASPLVVWEGSHEMVRKAFGTLLANLPPETWAEVDLTDTYHALRREIFATCPRREIHSRPGEAYLVHRLALHGVAPWDPAAEAGPDGRMIAYFRPEIGGPRDWLHAP